MIFGPRELWNDPLDGLPPELVPWAWDLIDKVENGKTKGPPDHRLETLVFHLSNA
jgi:hypothetical protein